MSALRKIEVYGSTGYEAAAPKKVASWLPVVIVTAQGTAAYEPAVPVVAEAKRESAAKNIALFLAAPFIGLAYLLAMPLVGLGALVWIGAKLLLSRVPAIRTAALILAAPFLGLAFIVATPFLGIGALAWVGSRGLAAR